MVADPLTGKIPDVNCNSLTSPTTYTGPNEVWWAPYDNRPGSTVCQPLDDNYPRGLLWPYIEQNPATFKCPLGYDIQTTSATFGQQFQCSYGMNYVTGGPNGKRITDLTTGNGSSNIIIVWDHGRTPGCANSTIAAPRGPLDAAGGRIRPGRRCDALPRAPARRPLQRALLRRPCAIAATERFAYAALLCGWAVRL